jgi:hypothetical protein
MTTAVLSADASVVSERPSTSVGSLCSEHARLAKRIAAAATSARDAMHLSILLAEHDARAQWPQQIPVSRESRGDSDLTGVRDSPASNPTMGTLSNDI